MSTNILVPLTGNIQIKNIITAIEQVATPGTTVIFLAHYVPFLLDGFDEWLKEQTRANKSRLETPTEARRKMEAYAKAKQRQLVWERLSPVLEALSKNGIQLRLELYEGSLKWKLREYSADRPMPPIVLRTPVSPEWGQAL